jgi:uncharacterized protein (TIGR00255 family)
MTGYGKAEIQLDNKSIVFEVKSLNSKQQDVNTRIPSQLKPFEMDMRNTLLGKLHRGKIELSAFIEQTGNQNSTSINKEVLKNYFNEVKELVGQEEITPEMLSALLRLPDVTSAEKDDVSKEDGAKIMNSLNVAIDALVEFRAAEGAQLGKDLSQRIALIENYLKEIEQLDIERVQNVKARLSNSISEIKENLVDQNRFEQELIYYLEKIDITEEKVRLKAHCSYFMENLNAAAEYKGKKLGFISQEIGREINTIGSKANDAAIQRIVVNMKDELEKIKEQVLNIL